MMSSSQRRFNTTERRPRMLKDFLIEKDLNSCSSSGFKSFPRKPNTTTIVEMKCSYSCNSNSTFQTIVTTVMKIIKRKLSKKRSQERTQIKIKDIIRWKSFRDLVEEHHQNPLRPLDLHRCHVDSIFTTNTTTSSSSCGSSWGDSDFFTSSWSWEETNDVVEAGKSFSFSPFVVGKDSVGPAEDVSCQEYEQQSPVSVLQVGEDEFSTFDQILASIERRKHKFIQTVQKLESLAKYDLANLDQHDEEYADYCCEEEVEEQDRVEERAKQLLHCVKAKCPLQSRKDYLDKTLLDFFREELAECGNKNRNDDEGFEWEMLKIAEDWINGSCAYDIGHVDKDAFMKDMDKRGRWNKFEEGQQELALEIETAIFHSLVADVLDLDS